ncbi:MAG: thiamine phosphate synthase [Desulfobacteraceae bacterium]|nr:thiamine phosphate synthase [Desulfobacteraceae bacterium]
MNETRIIDVNINRSAEGLRVLEDIARFKFDNAQTASDLRRLRHGIRHLFKGKEDKLLFSRDAVSDVGKEISQKVKTDSRTDLKDTALSNFKRVEEAFRSIEEQLKTIGEYREGKLIEQQRFSLYSIEKTIISFFKKRLPHGIYGILGEKFSNGKTNAEVAKEMIDSGIEIIQYREKHTEKSIKQIYEECCEIREITRQAGALFIVNDYADIALMVGADGIHAGQDDFPAIELKKIAGDMIVGISTHSPEQAEQAVKDGADYIGAGPVFATQTKEDVCDPVGFQYLDYVVENIDIPFVAIGGIKKNNLGSVLKRGARTVCLVTEIISSRDILKQVGEIKKIYRENII